MAAPISLCALKLSALTVELGISTSPTSEPAPTTMLSTPGGTPAASKISTAFMAVNAVMVAGLKTTVVPATSAGAIFHTGIATGKFQGVMQATTPNGCFIV